MVNHFGWKTVGVIGLVAIALAMTAIGFLRFEESSSSAGATSLSDTMYPSLGNGGYNALHYTLDLTLNVEANTL